MKVLKFGGSSLANKQRIIKVADIIKAAAKKEHIAVVLSALKGVTNMLIQAAFKAEARKPEYKTIIKEIKNLHITTINELFTPDKCSTVLNEIENIFIELKEFLHGVELIRECSPRILDLVMSFGERLSCFLVSLYLKHNGIKAIMVDAREIIVTDENYGKASVKYKKTCANIKKKLAKINAIPVVTGFIGATENKVTTTLGRNGSDYTASLIGAALDATSIEIWTDVDGVLSADPRYVKDAFTIPQLGYEEAMELSYFGAEVIHPYTMIPAIDKKIPLVIKNTFNPKAAGTVISAKIKKHKSAITGIASIENIALLNIEGGGMVGIPGIAARIFSALAKERVNIIMISQASSEHSICIGFRQSEAEKGVNALNQELAKELKAKQIEYFVLKRNLNIIAVIGENMRGTYGISGRLFSALGKTQINVLAIAQGSSERNISFVIKNSDKEKALCTIHRAFFNDK